jgi:uncharacterized protein YecE (DUF72 family)
MAGRITVGTSSWADPGFVEEWYPPGMPARERLPWYAKHFETVELNSSFYAIPEVTTVARWVEVTPPGFTFHVKLHQLLSRHVAKPESLPPDLRDEVDVTSRGRVVLTPELEREMAKRTLDAVRPLDESGKLSAFLLQLTPAFSPYENSLEELDNLLETLAPHPVAVEFRHRSWVTGDRAAKTFAGLSERAAVYVAVDAPPGKEVPLMPPVDAVTRDDLAYMRAHGRNREGYLHGKTVAERFGWRYSDEELEEIAARARKMAEQAEIVTVQFNNNRGRDAPTSAQQFRALLGQDTGPEPEEGQLRLS